MKSADLLTLRADQSALLDALTRAGADVTNPKKIRCPFHDDQSPSAGVYRREDGAWAFKCHGCKLNLDVVDVLARVERKTPADVLRGTRHSLTNGHARPATHREASRIDTVYPYIDEHGELLYEVLRYVPKDFNQRRPDGNGGYVWKMSGVRRILYRLPEILASGPDSFIFCCEGEKDANTLTSAGLVATTSSGGAGKWKKTDSAALTGRHVVLIPDNDDPGRAHARDVADDLHGRAASVRGLALPSELNGKPVKDANDWFDAGGDAEELVRMAEAAPLWTPTPAPTPALAIMPAPAPTATTATAATPTPAEDEPGLVVRCAADVEERPVEWLWRPRFVRGAINLVIGMPDVGKSVCVADIQARVTTGAHWPSINGSPKQPNDAGTVAVLSIEDDPATTIVPRLRAAGADCRKVQIIEAVNRLGDDGTRLRDSFDIARDVERLEKLCVQFPDLRLVTIDPLDSYINAKVDTNIGNKARAALWPLKDWAASTGVTVIIVHHFNKSATTNAMDKISGARSFGALPRSVWAMGRDEAGDRTILACVKMNLVRQEEKRAVAFRIRSSTHNPDVPCIHWLDEEVNTTASQLLGARGSQPREDAKTWLSEILADGPMGSGEIFRLGEEAGHSKNTLNRAKADLGIVPKQQRGNKRIVGWTWELPPRANSV